MQPAVPSESGWLARVNNTRNNLYNFLTDKASAATSSSHISFSPSDSAPTKVSVNPASSMYNIVDACQDYARLRAQARDQGLDETAFMKRAAPLATHPDTFPLFNHVHNTWHADLARASMYEVDPFEIAMELIRLCPDANPERHEALRRQLLAPKTLRPPKTVSNSFALPSRAQSSSSRTQPRRVLKNSSRFDASAGLVPSLATCRLTGPLLGVREEESSESLTGREIAEARKRNRARCVCPTRRDDDTLVELMKAHSGVQTTEKASGGKHWFTPSRSSEQMQWDISSDRESPESDPPGENTDARKHEMSPSWKQKLKKTVFNFSKK